MHIAIKRLNNRALLPKYQTDRAAAMDLHACLEEPVLLQPMERTMIPTGIAIELPPNYEAQVRARSGLSIKHGITVVNGVGTIDADYRGEIGVLVINLSKEPFTIEHEMRIAQMVVAPVEQITWREVSELAESARGESGYGSTSH